MLNKQELHSSVYLEMMPTMQSEEMCWGLECVYAYMTCQDKAE